MLKKRKIYINTKLIMILIILSFFFASYRSEKIIKETQKKQVVKAERNYQNIENKLNILNMVIYKLKTTDIFRMYFFESLSEAEKRYLKIKLYDQVKKTNTIHGNIGFSLNVGSIDENIIFSTQGTVDKFVYFKEEGLPTNLEDFKKYILVKKDRIIVYLKTEEMRGMTPIYWIISLTKDNFLSEIKFNLEDWYIQSGDEYINLKNESNILTQRKISKLKNKITDFFMPYFYGNLIYLEPRIDTFGIFIYEFTKVIGILTLLYLVIVGIKYFIFAPIKSLAMKFGYSGKNIKKEVEYIESKLDEISLTNKNLEYKINDMKVYQKEKKIKDYLLGITDRENLDKIKDESPIFSLASYRVIILEIFDAESVENIHDKFKITEEFFLKYFSSEILCEIINIDYKSIAIIVEDKLEDSELEEVMNCLEKHCERNFDLTFTIAITDVYTNIKDLSKAYREAKKILNYKFAFKQERVIFQKSIQQNNMKKYYYPIELEAKLINKTLNSSETTIRRVLDEIFEINGVNDIDKIEIKEFSGLLYNTLSRILLQVKEVNEEVELDGFNIKEMLDVDDFNQVKEVFEKKILEISKVMKTKDTNDNSDIKTKIDIYLEENYMIDISLENLADHLGHSFKYTSILFKKVMGDNFKNYLNVYRINKAKKLMEENTELKIKELAEIVGYNSSNTFIRIFKKYEGVSPGKMNSQLLREDE